MEAAKEVQEISEGVQEHQFSIATFVMTVPRRNWSH